MRNERGAVVSWLASTTPNQVVREHSVVFMGKTLNSHGASLHPGVQVATMEFNTAGNPAVDERPIQRRSKNTYGHFMLHKPG